MVFRVLERFTLFFPAFTTFSHFFPCFSAFFTNSSLKARATAREFSVFQKLTTSCAFFPASAREARIPCPSPASNWFLTSRRRCQRLRNRLSTRRCNASKTAANPLPLRRCGCIRGIGAVNATQRVLARLNANGEHSA